MSWANKRVVVTGCAGMIGSALCRRLLSLGASVYGVDDLSRGRSEFIPDGVAFKLWDLREGFPRSAEWFDPDYIFHLAARIGGVGKMHQDQYDSGSNVLIDRHVLDLVVRTRTPFYIQSTACVYPTTIQTKDDSDLLLSEDMAFPAQCESVYGWAKLILELQAQRIQTEYDIPASIGRAFNVVGPNECDCLEHSHVVPALIQKVLQAQDGDEIEVWGSGNQERSFLYVEDAVDGILAIAENITYHPVNIGQPDRYKINDLAQKIIDLSGKNLSISNDTTKPEGVFTRAANTNFISDKCGWYPKTSIEDALDRTYRWWVDTGMNLREKTTSMK